MISPKEDDAPPSAADDDTTCKRPRGEEEEEETKKRTRVEMVAAEEAKAKPSSSLTENNNENNDKDDNNRSGGTALIRGLPSRWDERLFRLALHEMDVTGHTKVKKRSGWTHAFVTFNFPSERELCLRKLQERAKQQREEEENEEEEGKSAGASGGGGAMKGGVSSKGWKFGKKVTMSEARDKGGKNNNSNNDEKKEKKKQAKTEARDAVCPLWNVKYSEQLKAKKEKVRKALAMVTELVGKANGKFKRNNNNNGKGSDVGGEEETERWLKDASARKNKRCCDLVGIVRSPVLEGYRNKSEFTIGNNNQGQPTIGFNVGLFREGNVAIGEPVGCRNISKVAICVQEAAQKYLRDVAGTKDALPSWDKRNGSGFWRLLIVREGGCAPSMLGDSDSNNDINSNQNCAAPAWRKWLRLEGERDEDEEDVKKPDDDDDDDEEDDNAEVTVNGIDDAEDALSLDAPTPKENSEVMVVVQINPGKEFEAAKMEKALKGIRDAMETAASAFEPEPFLITVQLRQHNELVSNMAAADAHTSELVVGNRNTANNKPMVICERMCGLKFSLSHSAFFQVNTAAAELLYALAGEWASPNGKSLLLDVCCGTGTIGLTLANSVGKVVGLDIVEDAIRDAEKNSKLNDRTNCEWIAGKAEDTLDVVLKKYGEDVKTVAGNTNEEEGSKDEHEEERQQQQKREFLYDDVVAIVDPPRCGLHKKVLNALRMETRLRKIVYVSCNPESMAQNCVELCALRTKNMGPPFRPRKAAAVDLFPHTAHCEAVLVLER
jgi:tRNA (uracil-5-)-methyltransferase